ncbi:MAG: hypothetical protein P4L67_04840 [Candidatus Pacebacteria bacterium]|nr:hypothetical protein [Candidatus Paceibacterota bacterium]
MAGLIGYATWTTANINANTLTVMQLVAPPNQRLRILGYEVGFDGTNSANAPGTLVVERQAGGSFTNTSVPPKKVNDPSSVGEVLQAVSKNTQTGAPTSGDVLHVYPIPVFGGLVIYPLPPGQEDMVPGGTILGLKVTTTAQVNCIGGVRYEE